MNRETARGRRAPLDVAWLLAHFPARIVITSGLVLLENALLALLPLFIGQAIDALLEAQRGALWPVLGLMLAVLVVAVARRFYDTRAYGSMRVRLGSELGRRMGHLPLSQQNARLDMSREMVDFLEAQLPELLSASVQIVISLCILWVYHHYLGLSALMALLALAGIYALFHQRFFHHNRALNAQVERQVDVLAQKRRRLLFAHLRDLRSSEVRLSDTEAWMYGLIYLVLFTCVLVNLSLAASLPAVTAGMVFAVLTYSWELMESGVQFPVALQQWTRLSEIRSRLNAIE